MQWIMDSHIHFDKYEQDMQDLIVEQSIREGIHAIVSVSMDLSSCKENFKLQQKYSHFVLPAYGFHPEQKLPNDDEMDQLFDWIEKHKEKMIAIGEVGLPTFTLLEAQKKNERFHLEPYVELLESFIIYAKRINKPILLHAVQQEASIVCELLEKHSVTKAHFHWYKGPKKTTERMAQNGYFVSITPEVVYDRESKEMVEQYPFHQLMIETDGPWPFEGPFTGQVTHPMMMKKSIESIASIKRMSNKEVSSILYENTKQFFIL